MQRGKAKPICRIYARAEGKEEEEKKVERNAKNMEQNNRAYFNEGGEDDFWGVN